MKETPLEQAHEGDILARELAGNNGVVILAGGSTLSASILARLKKMGIRSVTIKDTSPGGGSETANKLMTLLEARFAGTEANPYLQEIKTIAKDHLLKSA